MKRRTARARCLACIDTGTDVHGRPCTFMSCKKGQEKMKNTNEGDRVIVTIRVPEEYAQGCAAALDGLRGVVEEVEANPWMGKPAKRLVRFDTPAPTWFTHQSPAESFWLPAADLVAE